MPSYCILSSPLVEAYFRFCDMISSFNSACITNMLHYGIIRACGETSISYEGGTGFLVNKWNNLHIPDSDVGALRRVALPYGYSEGKNLFLGSIEAERAVVPIIVTIWAFCKKGCALTSYSQISFSLLCRKPIQEYGGDIRTYQRSRRPSKPRVAI